MNSTIPAHLLGERQCERSFDLCYGLDCPTAVKENSATGRWFITMGHPGFNSPANNRDGYSSMLAAEQAIRRYGRR